MPLPQIPGVPKRGPRFNPTRDSRCLQHIADSGHYEPSFAIFHGNVRIYDSYSAMFNFPHAATAAIGLHFLQPILIDSVSNDGSLPIISSRLYFLQHAHQAASECSTQIQTTPTELSSNGFNRLGIWNEQRSCRRGSRTLFFFSSHTKIHRTYRNRRERGSKICSV